MFRPRQKFFTSNYFPSILPEIKVNENKEYCVDYVNQCSLSLPDVETTCLADLIDAGVNLNQVESKIFPATNVVLHLDDDTNVPPTEGVNE